MKNNKLLIVLLSVLLVGLAGCSGEPTSEEYEIASKWCKDFGGTANVTSGGIAGLRARCNDSKLIIDDESN